MNVKVSDERSNYTYNTHSVSSAYSKNQLAKILDREQSLSIRLINFTLFYVRSVPRQLERKRVDDDATGLFDAQQQRDSTPIARCLCVVSVL